jgi:hypothetical protein
MHICTHPLSLSHSCSHNTVPLLLELLQKFKQAANDKPYRPTGEWSGYVCGREEEDLLYTCIYICMCEISVCGFSVECM